MVTPQRSLLLLVYVFTTLGLMAFLLPEKVELVAGQFLQIPRTEDFMPWKTRQQYADISAIQKNLAASPKKVEKSAQKPTLDPKLVIQLPPDKPDVLQGFLKSLRQLNQETLPVRVLHFGDSQLEGDRITGTLRAYFQQQFGGCGLGTLPISNVYYRNHVLPQTRGNWLRNNFRLGKNARRSERLGVLGYRFSFAGQGEMKLQIAPAQYKITSIEQLRVWYANPQTDMSLQISTDGQSATKYDILSTAQFSMLEAPLTKNPKNIQLQFKSSQRAEVYGIALDCPRGVTFDNIPLRGSSGVEFTQFDREWLKAQLQVMNVKLLILQFGVNIVPYVRQDYKFYEDQFYEELQFLKSLAPDISILVVGVSDMSRKVKGNYVSYPNIEKIRQAQKQAAFRAGCAFWDLYEAMGGANSMPAWVFAKPALATMDFTHFSQEGADLVAQMLFKGLMDQYEKSLAQQQMP
ncbi:MAG TPA: hypothetical protein DCM08_10300 [Microscillaceae bacterium]|jgi:lysophospholipase L1-like esterase|nr:hypothetical protein [Microscillaceae bacterium]